MSCAEAVAEALSEFGDADELASAVSLVVLKLEKPLQTKKPLPRQLSLDSDGWRLTTDHEGFAACRGFLTRHAFPAVLFAGCPELASTRSFLIAARDVLCGGTHTLIIVHNRDRLLDLVTWFPSVSVLVLYHDLKLQIEKKELVEELKHSSRLERLYGTTPALGADKLFLCPLTLTVLMANCPLLSQVQAPLHEIVQFEPVFPRLTPPSLLDSCRELTLGCNVRRPDGESIMLGDAAPVLIDRVRKYCPAVEQLHVTATAAANALTRLKKFTRLRRLSLMHAGDTRCPFNDNVKGVLQTLSLTHLALEYIHEVSVSTIAETCTNLQSLSLSNCQLLDEAVADDAFPKLKHLCLCEQVSVKVFRTIFHAARGLTDLRLDGANVVAPFVTWPFRAVREPYKFLQRLTLGTDKSLEEMSGDPVVLRATFRLMPALQWLCTDSYDIRIFAQCYHPSLALAWTRCTTCMAEFPKVDASQEEIWRKVLGDEK